MQHKPYLRQQKNFIRDEYIKKRSMMDIQEKNALDMQIQKKFIQTITYRHSKILLIYSALRDEIQTDYIIDAALEAEKIVALPKCESNLLKMSFHIIKSRDQLCKGTYSILEPDPALPVLDFKEYAGTPTVCIVPGLVFDKNGNRIGYGKGYYDRFLNNFQGVKAAFTYEGFIVDDLPRGRFDTVMDIIITQKRCINVNA